MDLITKLRKTYYLHFSGSWSVYCTDDNRTRMVTDRLAAGPIQQAADLEISGAKTKSMMFQRDIGLSVTTESDVTASLHMHAPDMDAHCREIHENRAGLCTGNTAKP